MRFYRGVVQLVMLCAFTVLLPCLVSAQEPYTSVQIAGNARASTSEVSPQVIGPTCTKVDSHLLNPAGGWSATCESGGGHVAFGSSAAVGVASDAHTNRAAARAVADAAAFSHIGEWPAPTYGGAGSASAQVFIFAHDELFFPDGGVWVPSGHITASVVTNGHCEWAQFSVQLLIGGQGVTVNDQCVSGADSGGASISIALSERLSPITIAPGGRLQFSLQMFAGATAQVSAQNTSMHTDVNAMNTFELYLSPVTPGMRVTSASGTNFLLPSGPVPDPDPLPYRFGGFVSPVANAPVVNVVKAGSAIPVKFSLGADHGLEIFAAGFPKSQAVQCESSLVMETLTETQAAGVSGLTYDAESNQYTYVWKTEKGWAGSCRVLTLKFGDGQTHMAHLLFRR